MKHPYTAITLSIAIACDDRATIGTMRDRMGDEEFYALAHKLTPGESARMHGLLAEYDEQCLRAALWIIAGLMVFMGLWIYSAVSSS